MSKRKPAQYVHCSKCGYRGVDPNHDCTKVRASIAAVVDQAQRREIDEALARERAEPEDGERTPRALQLSQLSVEHSRLLGRHVSYVEVLREHGRARPPGSIEIHQRCMACCSDITLLYSLDETDPLAGLKLGVAARRVYLLHSCPLVDNALNGFTYEELEVLHMELERDAMKMMERASMIEKLKKARVG